MSNDAQSTACGYLDLIGRCTIRQDFVTGQLGPGRWKNSASRGRALRLLRGEKTSKRRANVLTFFMQCCFDFCRRAKAEHGDVRILVGPFMSHIFCKLLFCGQLAAEGEVSGSTGQTVHAHALASTTKSKRACPKCVLGSLVVVQ